MSLRAKNAIFWTADYLNGDNEEKNKVRVLKVTLLCFAAFCFLSAAATFAQSSNTESKTNSSVTELSLVCVAYEVCEPKLGVTRDKAEEVVSVLDVDNFRTENGQTALQFVLAGIGMRGGKSPSEIKKVLHFAKKLLEKGADVDAIGALGLTALHDATVFRHVEVVRFLLGNGASPQVVAGAGRFKGKSAIELAVHLKAKDKEVEDSKLDQIIKLMQESE